MPFSTYFKKNWKNYLLLLSTIIIILIGLEVFLRLDNYFNEPCYFEEDKYLKYKLKEGFERKIHLGKGIFGESYNLKVNSKGLRDYEYDYHKPDNTYRILILGDSFAFGHGVELDETFPKILEKKLNKRANDIKYRVINAGVPSYATADELDFLKL